MVLGSGRLISDPDADVNMDRNDLTPIATGDVKSIADAMLKAEANFLSNTIPYAALPEDTPWDWRVGPPVGIPFQPFTITSVGRNSNAYIIGILNAGNFRGSSYITQPAGTHSGSGIGLLIPQSQFSGNKPANRSFSDCDCPTQP